MVQRGANSLGRHQSITVGVGGQLPHVGQPSDGQGRICEVQLVKMLGFFRSYGARLPSSLTRFHSRALAQLCPPTCVGFRYGQPWEHTKVFLGSCFNGSASAEASTSLLLRADRHFQSATHFHRNVTSELNHSRCRNIKPAVHRLRPSAST